MLREVDESREWHDGSAGPIGVCQRMCIRMRTRQWRKIRLSPDVGTLLGNPANDIRECNAALKMCRQYRPPNIARWLKTGSSNPRPLLRKSHNSSQLVVVHSRLNRANQNRSYARLSKLLDRLQLRLNKRFAAQLPVRGIVE